MKVMEAAGFGTKMGMRLRVESKVGIYSDKAGEMIGTNGYHDAVKEPSPY